MIPAIDPGIGLKEDIAVPPAPPVGNKNFAKALRRAEEHSKPSTSKAPAGDPSDGDPRVRPKYGQESDRASEADAKPASEKEMASEADGQSKTDETRETSLDEAAEPTLNPHLKRSSESTSIEELMLEAEETRPLSFTQSEESGQVGQIEDQTPINAQFGSAVWRLSQHGNQEAKFASAAGVALPGSAEAELAQAGNLDRARNAMLEVAKKPDGTSDPSLARSAEVQEFLEFSQEAKGKVGRKGLSQTEQVQLEAAQSRNQLMAQIAAGSAEGDSNGLETEVAQNFLRDRMQMEGVFSKSARALAQNQADVEATVPISGPPPGVGGVNRAHIFETPTDKAVQQRVIEQVASEARWMITNNKSQVTLRLHPESLGEVNIKVVQEDGGILRIDMRVDTLAAKQLLETHLNELREKLAADNLADQFKFDVNVRKDHQQSDLQSRDPETPASRSNRLGSLEMAVAAGAGKRASNHSGWSIYA